jgi:hypothetical protein
MGRSTPLGFTISAGAFLGETETGRLLEASGRNDEKAFNYLKTLGDVYKCDLFAPERDEILLGLFARLTRLSFRICTDFSRWATWRASCFAVLLKPGSCSRIFLAQEGLPLAVRDVRQ